MNNHQYTKFLKSCQARHSEMIDINHSHNWKYTKIIPKNQHMMFDINPNSKLLTILDNHIVNTISTRTLKAILRTSYKALQYTKHL